MSREGERWVPDVGLTRARPDGDSAGPTPTSASPTGASPADGGSAGLDPGERDALGILAVDDDSIFLMGLARMLRDLPCTFDPCETPERALERLARTSPALLLIDLHMPRMGGLELLARVRELPGAGTVDVYLQSAGRASPDVVSEAARLGAEIVDKAVVLDRQWLEAVIERCEGRRAAPGDGSAIQVA